MEDEALLVLYMSSLVRTDLSPDGFKGRLCLEGYLEHHSPAFNQTLFFTRI
jgi:hypothetical protein